MAEEKKKARSTYFDIPDISMFTEGNNYVGSSNTFNFRIAPDSGKLSASVWYGEKCFELSEPVDTLSEDMTEEGLISVSSHLDKEYEKYLRLLEAGEVKGRRTYKQVTPKTE